MAITPLTLVDDDGSNSVGTVVNTALLRQLETNINTVVAVGAWTTPAYNAGDFTSDSGTWVVDAGDVGCYAYRLVGKTMTINFNLTTTTVTGTPGGLRLKIPGGFTCAKTLITPYLGNNNGGAWATRGCNQIGTLGFLILMNDLTGASNWAAGTNNNNMSGSVTFEVV